MKAFMFYLIMPERIRDTANIEASGLKFILSDLDFSVVVVVEVVAVVLQSSLIMGSNSHMESSHLNEMLLRQCCARISI